MIMRSSLLALVAVSLTRCAIRTQPPETAPHVERNPAIAPTVWQRCAHGAATIGSSIYVVGGINPSGDHSNLSRVDRYDVPARTWSTVAPCPTPRAFSGVAALDGRLHVVAGLTNDQKDSPIHECYDPASDTWSTLAPLPTPRSRLAMVAASGKLYALGGMIHGAEHADSAIVEVYDPRADRWTRAADLPTARHAHAAVAVDGRVYVVGGYALKRTLAPLNACEIFDVAAGTWSAGPSTLSPRSWFGLVAIGTTIAAVGGASHPEVLRPPYTGWTTLPDPDVSDRRFAAAALGATVFILGGEADAVFRTLTITEQ